MKLSIIKYDMKKTASYSVTFKYGQHEFISNVTIKEGVVPYVEYEERLQKILHKDVGEAKNMNRVIFKMYREEAVEMPIEIGEF